MTIHKEGYFSIIITLVILGIINFAARELLGSYAFIIIGVQILSLIVFLLILNFFRSPFREISSADNTVIAPADGKVVVIEETIESEVLKDRRIQISIFMSPLNVHI